MAIGYGTARPLPLRTRYSAAAPTRWQKRGTWTHARRVACGGLSSHYGGRYMKFRQLLIPVAMLSVLVLAACQSDETTTPTVTSSVGGGSTPTVRPTTPVAVTSPTSLTPSSLTPGST